MKIEDFNLFRQVEIQFERPKQLKISMEAPFVALLTIYRYRTYMLLPYAIEG